MKLFNSKKKENAPKGKGRVTLIVCLALIAVLLVLAVVGVSYVHALTTIFPKVTMDGIDLGGMTTEAAAEVLRGEGYDEVKPVTVTVMMPAGYTLTVSSAEVGIPVSAADVANDALYACKEGSSVQEALRYVTCLLGGMALESDRTPSVDEQAVKAAVENTAAEVRTALLSSGITIGEDSVQIVKGAQNAEIDTEALTGMIVEALLQGEDAALRYDAKITSDESVNIDEIYQSVYAERADAYFSEEEGIVPEVVGLSFDKAEAEKLLSAAAFGDTVEIPLILDLPELTAEDLEALIFRDKLSERSTSLSGSSSNRINNVKKAAESINETILMPGEEFDYNKALGKRTAENGYLPAGAYSGGQTVQEYGGGICQVSSTLYYCCLYANLQITARTCHMFPVAYLPAGLDATVSWGGPEYKFVNNREYPIKIISRVDEEANTVIVELWGTDVDGSYVEMNYSTWFVFDETYPDVKIGYKAQTYRSVFDKDGTLLSRKAETISFYGYHDEDIEWPQEVLDQRAREEAEARGEVWEPSPSPEISESPEVSESPDVSASPEVTESPLPEESPEPTPTPEPTEPVGE